MVQSNSFVLIFKSYKKDINVENCLFCNIVNGQIPCKEVYSDNDCIAFHDINPQAPHHILIIPKKHIATTNDINESNSTLVGHLFHAASQIAKDLQVDEAGYRLVFNCNKHGGQEVYHIHLHLLAGRAMTWPPG